MDSMNTPLWLHKIIRVEGGLERFEITDIYTPLAMLLLIASFITLGGAIPLLIIFGYLSVQRENKIKSLRYSIEYLENYKDIDTMLKSDNIGKEKLAHLVRLAKRSDAFEQIALALGAVTEEIENVKIEFIAPYQKSFNEAETLLKTI